MKDYRGTCLTRHYIRADAVEAVEAVVAALEYVDR